MNVERPSEDVLQFSLCFDQRRILHVIEVHTDDGWTPVTSTMIDWVACQCRKRLGRTQEARIVTHDLELP